MKINLDDFIDKYDGKSHEEHGSANAKYQCVDLVNAYIREVLGLPIIKWTNAKDFSSRAGDKYDFIKNTPLGIPKKGDIIVWNSNVGWGHGHISIFIEGNVNWFASFDQNWSIAQKCTIEGHTYEYVKGWLRPKAGFINDDLEICLKQRKKLVEEAGKKDKIISSQDKKLLKFGALKKPLIEQVEKTVVELNKVIQEVKRIDI